jgi:hypothetical protein
MNLKLFTLAASLITACAALAVQAATGTTCIYELTAWLHLAAVPPMWHYCASEIRSAALEIFSEQARAERRAYDAELAALRAELAGLDDMYRWDGETPPQGREMGGEDEQGFSLVTRAQKLAAMERIKQENQELIFQNQPGARVFEFE